MNALLILLVAAVILVIGYVCYGGWLAKQWGVDPKNPTPAHELEDGVDYVPAPPYVVLGHHFSSIAGAGPINGPIQAAVFGWVPVLLWVLIGGIFFGAMHDFGALFASLRHKGQTLAVVVAENIDNQQTAMISVIFIGVAVVYGFVTRGRNIPGPVNIASAIVLIVIMVAIGYNLPLMGISLSLDYNTWMIILGVYILIASVAPVWILLQPRDYLSSYLLYGMILLAVIGIVGASLTGAAANLQIPAFTGFVATNAAFDASTGQALVDQAGKAITNKAAASGFLFPALFITIACGAISGFHSLVASGTTSKQLDREAEAQPIGYGGMLIECLLAVISLCAVGFVWSKYAAGGYASPTAVFADGLSQMLACIPGLANVQGLAYALLILAVSAFCLTSLDTATRLARYMFQELWTPVDANREDLTGVRKAMTNPYVATIITVVIGVFLGMTGYTIIWPLFGAANQLLAALALLAVCAWLGNAGRNNKMFFVPMGFMLAATLTSLGITFYQKTLLIMKGGDIFAPAVQALLAVLLFVLAVVLAVKGVKTIVATAKRNAA